MLLRKSAGGSLSSATPGATLDDNAPSAATPKATADLRTDIMDFRGFDSSMILCSRGGIPRPIGNFPECLSQAILVWIMLVGRLSVTSGGAVLLDLPREGRECATQIGQETDIQTYRPLPRGGVPPPQGEKREGGLITPSPPTKSLDVRGFDSSRLLILRGGNYHVR